MELKALILNGERKDESVLDLVYESLVQALSSDRWVAEAVFLREKKIARCTGCFGCWTKTPGVCVIDDFGRELARMVVQSDLMIYLTPITFGGYSSELKKAVDRFACSLLLPFFTRVKGEVHHKPRYTPLPRLIGIGVLPDSDAESERIFTKLVEGNAINLHAPSSHSLVFYSSQNKEEREEKLRSLLLDLGT